MGRQERRERIRLLRVLYNVEKDSVKREGKEKGSQRKALEESINDTSVLFDKWVVDVLLQRTVADARGKGSRLRDSRLRRPDDLADKD